MLRVPGLRQVLGRHPSFPGLAARTLFFDQFVVTAPDLEREHMAGTVLAGQLKTGAFQVTART